MSGNSGLTIRRAINSDVNSAYQLIMALGYPVIGQEEFKSTFLEVLANRNSLVYLAEDAEGQAVGLMTLSHKPQLRLVGEILNIDELSVLDGARGKGVGHALLNEARKVAVELNAKRIELHTNRARESYERRFYFKNGFTEANSALMRLDRDEF